MSNKVNNIRRVVLVRHGQSQYNGEKRFTGWEDVNLTQKGVEEAKQAGLLLKSKGFTFDVGYTSMLTRAIRTYNYLSAEMGLDYIPIHKSWRLNERHYGALQGLSKAETALKHGKDKTMMWRRSYQTQPPELNVDDPRHPAFDPRYKKVPSTELPSSESLKMCSDRVLPYWYDVISPQVHTGKNVIVVAHGNCLRAIVKHMSGIDENEIYKYNIPTACPLVYEFNENMETQRSYYLIDEDTLKRRQEEVAMQSMIADTHFRLDNKVDIQQEADPKQHQHAAL